MEGGDMGIGDYRPNNVIIDDRASNRIPSFSLVALGRWPVKAWKAFSSDAAVPEIVVVRCVRLPLTPPAGCDNALNEHMVHPPAIPTMHAFPLHLGYRSMPHALSWSCYHF
jgi:hypothetical protein